MYITEPFDYKNGSLMCNNKGSLPNLPPPWSLITSIPGFT